MAINTAEALLHDYCVAMLNWRDMCAACKDLMRKRITRTIGEIATERGLCPDQTPLLRMVRTIDETSTA